MIYFGCTLVAIWIAGFFYARRPRPSSDPADGKSATDRWVKRNADHLMRATFIAIGLLWIYGVYFYPDAPITRCGEGYCGKGGVPHTLEEFRAFEKWQDLFFFTFILGFLTLLYLRTKIPSNQNR